MPHLSVATLGGWVEEFERTTPSIPGAIRVLERDHDDESDDSGLVVVELATARVDTYLERRGEHGLEWTVTFAARYDDLAMGHAEVASLGAELVGISVLCAFLQARTVELARSLG